MKQILNKLFSQPKEEGGITDVMRNSRQWERDLSAEECRKVNIVQRWATRQRNLIYDQLNEAVKNAR